MTILIMMMAMTTMGVVTSDVITCRIQVNSGTRSTILSLPFTQLGGDAETVELDKVVLTDNLEDGTFLFAAVAGQTHAWRLTNGAWTKFAAVDGFDHTSDTAAVNAFTRGAAFWVERAGDAEAIAKPFYIYGLAGAKLSGVQQIAGASIGNDGKVVAAYTRIGNPNPEDRRINDLVWTGCSTDDVIAIGDDSSNLGYAEYIFRDGEWGLRRSRKNPTTGRRESVWDNNIVLPAGQGFWYVRRASGEASVSFAAQQ